MKSKDKFPNLGRAHAENLQIFGQKRQTNQSLIAQIMEMPWPKGEGAHLDVASKKLRIEALRIALENGRPLAVIEEFRELIEGSGESGTLTEESHLSKLIYLFGIFLDSELKTRRFISIGGVFDGLNKDGEWASSLFRGVLEGEEMILLQGLLDMPHTTAPYNHAVLNRILIKAFSKLSHCGPLEKLFRFLMHDDAAVNNLSCTHLKEGMLPAAKSISCIVHSLDRIGHNPFIPLVVEFKDDVTSIFTNADKRKFIFRRLTQLDFPSINKIKVKNSPYFMIILC